MERVFAPRDHDLRWQGLRHPAWWLALALLALNDHVLKGSGALPGWLTGKLSDFAGILVAPALLVALAGARTRRSAAWSFGLVAAGFAAIKTLPLASRGYELALGAVGFPSNNVCDPTDLVALAALPLAWWMTTTYRAPLTARLTLERAGVALGALACVATSPPNPVPRTWSTDAFVVNRSQESIDLRVRWIAATLDCAAVARSPRSILRRELFNAQPVTYQLDPGATIPLERRAARNVGTLVDGGVTADTTPRTCDAALLQADGMPTMGVFWQGGTMQSIPSRLPDAGAGLRQGIILDGSAGSVLVLNPSSDVTLFVADGELSSCVTPSSRFQVGGDPAVWGAQVTVRALERLPDGCTRVEGADAQGNPRLVYLCVPNEAIPLRAGDSARFELTSDHEVLITAPGGMLRVLTNAPWPARRVVGTVAMSFATEPRCAGHGRCNGYVERSALVIEGNTTPLLPGASTRTQSGATVFLGRAERVVVAPEACATEFPQTGPVVDLAILTSNGG